MRSGLETIYVLRAFWLASFLYVGYDLSRDITMTSLSAEKVLRGLFVLSLSLDQFFSSYLDLSDTNSLDSLASPAATMHLSLISRCFLVLCLAISAFPTLL